VSPSLPPRAPAGTSAPDRHHDVDYAALYDAHPEYAARRDNDGYERARVEQEVALYKLPNLLSLLHGPPVKSVLEIGCATGELMAAWPVAKGGERLGIDISTRNVEAAAQRHPQVRFVAGDVTALDGLGHFDVVLLSDVLEHVPDDVGLLRTAAALGSAVLVNLPLEDNWLNRHRAYGPDDVSGHLRRYDLAQGRALAARAGLVVERWHRAWAHESPLEPAARALRRQWTGTAYGGPAWTAPMRVGLLAAARAVRPLGRRLFASNLYMRLVPASQPHGH